MNFRVPSLVYEFVEHLPGPRARLDRAEVVRDVVHAATVRPLSDVEQLPVGNGGTER
jgi:hypothetical protein